MLDYFPLFLCFINSLIKFDLWLKFFYRQKAGRGCVDGNCSEKALYGPTWLHLNVTKIAPECVQVCYIFLYGIDCIFFNKEKFSSISLIITSFLASLIFLPEITIKLSVGIFHIDQLLHSGFLFLSFYFTFQHDSF